MMMQQYDVLKWEAFTLASSQYSTKVGSFCRCLNTLCHRNYKGH